MDRFEVITRALLNYALPPALSPVVVTEMKMISICLSLLSGDEQTVRLMCHDVFWHQASV